MMLRKHIFPINWLFFLMLSVFVLAKETNAQNRSLPDAKIQDLEGNWKNISEVVKNEGPVILSFWATWCKPCLLELNNIKEVYPEWQEKYNAKLIAVSVDDSRNTLKVKPLVDGKSWPYEVVLDPNGDLKRALNVNLIPHTFLIDKNGQIVWQHTNYVPGDEDELGEEIAKAAE